MCRDIIGASGGELPKAIHVASAKTVWSDGYGLPRPEDQIKYQQFSFIPSMVSV